MATDPLRHPGGITPPPTRPPGNPLWPWALLIGLALAAGMLWWHPWTGLAGPHSSPSPTHVGKKAKPIPAIVQLQRERVRRIKAEAKVAELRKLLRSAKARPVRTVGGSQTLNVKHSGKIEHGGEIRFLFGGQGAPTFPVIPPPATK